MRIHKLSAQLRQKKKHQECECDSLIMSLYSYNLYLDRLKMFPLEYQNRISEACAKCKYEFNFAEERAHSRQPLLASLLV